VLTSVPVPKENATSAVAEGIGTLMPFAIVDPVISVIISLLLVPPAIE
jgi:hypothetical protein